jgi:protease-4
MRRFFVGLFAVIGVISVISFAGLIALVVALARLGGGASPAPLPNSIVLTVDLSPGLSDGPDSDPLAKVLFGETMTLRDFVDALERAGDDSRVKGLFLQLSDDKLGLAKTQEVRDAIRAFRDKGKFVIAFADTFGEGAPGTRPYYLAVACDEVWLQPLGEVGLTGLRTETMFFRDALETIGVAAHFEHRGEYKSAMNTFTEMTMTGPQREEVEALLASMAGQIDRGIAEARKLTEAQVMALVDRGPFTADEAKTAGLVDTLGYRDEALDRAEQRAGTGAKRLPLSRYLARAGRPHESGSRIALIYGTGLITRRGGTGALTGDSEFNARAVARAFDAAIRDGDVRAILFRIDSPGGSAIASETVWREVERAREHGKPVIVTMGDVAASGGYYAAAPADKIVAEPATLTGSIGVLAGKIVVADLLKKLSIAVDSAQRGTNADLYTMTADFSPQARERLDQLLDTTYSGFKQHVAAGRHMSPDAVEAAARGRVWSGEDAKEKGLVDELGGYATALRLVRESAKLAPDAPLDIVVYPRDRGLAATLFGRLLDRDNDDEATSSGALQRGVTAIHSIVGLVEAVLDDPRSLLMPPIGEIR